MLGVKDAIQQIELNRYTLIYMVLHMVLGPAPKYHVKHLTEHRVT